jgi:hypothetical protein
MLNHTKRAFLAVLTVTLAVGPTGPAAALSEAPRRVSEAPEDRQDSYSRRPAPAKPKLRKLVPSDPEKRCPMFEPLFRAYGLKPVDTFSYIAWRESRCRIKAQNIVWNSRGEVVYALNTNGSFDTGLLQINSTWKTVTRNLCGPDAVDKRMSGLLELACNLRVAKYLLDNGGLGHWGF